jgi:dTMP kinase
MSDAAPTWLDKLRGRFLVFDGPDGSGKSTQFRRFAEYIRRAGLPVTELREPGGTPIGEQIRTVLLDPANHEMDVRCEMLLYMASRAQVVAQHVAPALQRGDLVLADRFISSTLAYQGAAGGMPIADIEAVGRVVVGTYRPDLIVIFDVDEHTAAGRLSPLLDRMERKGAAFHRAVRQGYLDQIGNDPAHYLRIDATPDADTVFAHLLDALAERAEAPDLSGPLSERPGGA